MKKAFDKGSRADEGAAIVSPARGLSPLFSRKDKPLGKPHDAAPAAMLSAWFAIAAVKKIFLRMAIAF